MDQNTANAISGLVEFIRNDLFAENAATLDIFLKEHSAHTDLIYDLGISCAESGRTADALLIFGALKRYKSQDFRIPYNLGCLFAMSSDYPAARDHFQQALELSPNDIDVIVNYASALHELCEYKKAIDCYERAVVLQPNSIQAWANKGNSFSKIGCYEDAMGCLNKAILLDPNYIQTWVYRAYVKQGLGQFQKALEDCDVALRLDPKYQEAWANKGFALQALKRYDEAVNCYDQAIQLAPSFAEVWRNKGAVLIELAQVQEAQKCFDTALSLNPQFHKARWAKLFSSIPSLSIEKSASSQSRSKCFQELEDFNRWISENGLEGVFEAVGSSQPFYLAYQEANNKELLLEYGKLCNRIMNAWQKFHNIKIGEVRKGDKIKVGIASDHIRNHSVWHAIIKGLLLNLNSNEFEVHIFYLGNVSDDQTDYAKPKATTFSSSQFSLLAWAKLIVEKELDVLIYPEIGMHQLTMQLATLRLAPIQMVCWGHPETSGLSSIDYYLSAQLFEAEDSQQFYTEKLIDLPNLGCSYPRSSIAAAKTKLDGINLESDYPILICPGTPFKYAPENDWILVEIAKRLGKCKLIFFSHQKNLTEILSGRLEKAFTAINLSLDDYVIFLPWLKPEEFYGLMKSANVYLDTIGFSGFNTAMQAVECALPIVTKKGQFMRGRLASGILEKMGMPELVVQTDLEYIELAVKLASDEIYRQQMSKKILSSQDCLYDDPEPIQALEKFLIEKCRS